MPVLAEVPNENQDDRDSFCHFGGYVLDARVGGPCLGIQRSLSPDQTAVALSQLQAKYQHIAGQLPEPPKGPAMARYMSKRSQLEDLIKRIQIGQPVSPDEIDQALQPTYQ